MLMVDHASWSMLLWAAYIYEGHSHVSHVDICYVIGCTAVLSCQSMRGWHLTLEISCIPLLASIAMLFEDG